MYLGLAGRARTSHYPYNQPQRDSSGTPRTPRASPVLGSLRGRLPSRARSCPREVLLGGCRRTPGRRSPLGHRSSTVVLPSASRFLSSLVGGRLGASVPARTY